MNGVWKGEVEDVMDLTFYLLLLCVFRLAGCLFLMMMMMMMMTVPPCDTYSDCRSDCVL